MSLTRRVPLLLIALAITATGCTRRAIEEAAMPSANPRPENVRLIERLASLNHCESDVDCEDLGYVCDVGCHVPYSRKLTGEDYDPRSVADRIYENAPCDVEAAARQCGPFFGLMCQRGRCVARDRAPTESICWANRTPGPPVCPRPGAPPSEAAPECIPPLRRIDCLSVLREHAPFIDCRDYCDGKNAEGRRFWGCADLTDGSASCFVIDYVSCDECLASREPQPRAPGERKGGAIPKTLKEAPTSAAHGTLPAFPSEGPPAGYISCVRDTQCPQGMVCNCWGTGCTTISAHEPRNVCVPSIESLKRELQQRH